jgi:hypothetical protein
LIYLAVLALFIGPLLYAGLRQAGVLARLVDSGIAVMMVALVVVMLVPEVFTGLGWTAFVLIATGYLAPLLLEFILKRAAHTFHMISLVAAILGLALHAALDGAGLAGSALLVDSQLALVIVLHRLGVGLMLWILVQPAMGRHVAVLVLLMMAIATVAGYHLSVSFLPLTGEQSILIVQALIIGTILHSLIHRGHIHQPHTD